MSTVWVLVLILKTNAVAIDHVPGFLSKQACETAGKLWDRDPKKDWLGWATHVCLPVDAAPAN